MTTQRLSAELDRAISNPSFGKPITEEQRQRALASIEVNDKWDRYIVTVARLKLRYRNPDGSLPVFSTVYPDLPTKYARLEQMAFERLLNS